MSVAALNFTDEFALCVLTLQLPFQCLTSRMINSAVTSEHLAGNNSCMFQLSPEGTPVEVGFTGGCLEKPFVRQTMPEGTSLPDVKLGEQLQ